MPTCRYCKRENAETKCIYCDGKLSARDILGLEGLNKDDRAIFFSAFNAEWTKLKSQEFLGH